MKVCVVGAGYVGLVSGVGLCRAGHEVVITDKDCERITTLRLARAPFFEAGLDDLLREGISEGRLSFTTDPISALPGTDVSMIAVGTPTRDGQIDLTAVVEVAQTIGNSLRGREPWHTVVVKSTVVPGTTDGEVRSALEDASGLTAGRDFGLAVNPEFLREGRAVADFLHPDRVVVGSSDARSAASLRDLYASFSCPKLEVTPVNAELIKYASNALLSTLISFSNEWAGLCESVPGADVETVMNGIHLDRRLARTEDGAPIRPGILAYLAAGPGFGGSCLPKDLAALRAFAAGRSAPTPLLDAVARVNAERPRRVVETIRRELGFLNGRTIALIGLAFKPGTDDTRDSPTLPIVRELQSAGASTRVWDPMVNGSSDLAGARRSKSPEDLLRDADAAVLITAWPEVASWPWDELLSGMRSRTIVDTRNALRTISWPEGVRYVPGGHGPDAL